MSLAAVSRARRCIVTGDEPGEAALLRFALGPDGVVTPDVGAKLPGRGAWVRAQRDCVDSAVKRGAFARAFKAQVKASPDLSDQAEAALARRCLDLLGMARKAGALAIGFEQVEAAFRANAPLGLIEAADGAADGRDKLVKLAFGLWGQAPVVVGCFTAAELGMALGRDRVVHAGWLQERFARVWAVETGRLSGFRALAPESWRPDPSSGAAAATPRG
jgi:predicted RNA-binding protein YlxR (DUF448 family)